ncbi:hypothetical protein CVIRNUC_007088 [Coccomyxa viridis]|uniref:Uncharacterized protein n=1 Tax=Coccomyxa viridis TaxID=1274662 RepID=A0AAV1I935_9CHLO|nr:hypothetical protein CVIRNUC_007088 [Coccomyxa viridis]
MQKVLGGSHERRGQGRGACPGHSGAASEAEGAVAAMRMEGLQRSRMGSGQASAAGSMLLRAAAMDLGQCLSAEFFLGDDGDQEVVDGWDLIQQALCLAPGCIHHVCSARVPALSATASIQARGCHELGACNAYRQQQRVPGLRACPGCSGCRSAACGAPASALAFQLAHHLRAWPAVIPTAVSVCFQGHDCGPIMQQSSGA